MKDFLVKPLIKETVAFMEKDNFLDIINKYKKLEYYVGFGKDCLIIKTRKENYSLGIIEENKILYWHLKPYNNSYFETKVNIGKGNVEKLLFVIEENEKLFINSWIKINKV